MGCLNYTQTEDKRANDLGLFSLARDVTCLLTRRGVALVYNAVNRDRRCFFFSLHLHLPIPSSCSFFRAVEYCRGVVIIGLYYLPLICSMQQGTQSVFFPSLFSLQRSFLAGMIRF